MISKFFKDFENFEGKKENETLIVFARRHPITQIPYVIGCLFLMTLPLFIILFLGRFIIEYSLANVFALLWVIYLMIIWFVLFHKLTMFILDTWIVTDERIIDTLQLGLFKRKVSELQLEAVQDISVNTDGVLQSYIDYGNVEIQTGAAAQRFLFEQVPNPIDIKDKIVAAISAVNDKAKK